MRVPVVDAPAPATRLAALRLVVGVFALGYLVVRLPVFTGLADRSAPSFDGVGLFALVGRPLASEIVHATIVLSMVAGVAFVAGAGYRVAGPAFALGMLVLTSYRSSWGQLLHFENLIVLHLAVVAFAPAADVWSIDARRRGATDGMTDGATDSSGDSERYGWPIGLAAMVTVITYVLAGVAKLRYGGFEWVTGDTLRNHIAYSATRLDVLGGSAAPLAEFAVRHRWALPPMAAASVMIELSAPVVGFGGRVRTAWVTSAWLMHAAIFATMLVGFPSPLFGVAFAPFFRLERLITRLNCLRQSVLRRPWRRWSRST